MSLKEYKSGTAFTGVIGRTFDQSEPAWPEPLRAKEGAPNVLFIILDDTGFGTAWLLMVCCTLTCTPPRCARRRAHVY
jgi:hypothetical protein